MTETAEAPDSDESFEVPNLDVSEEQYRRYCRIMMRDQQRRLGRHYSFWVFATGVGVAFVAAAAAAFAGAVSDRGAATIAVLAMASYLAGFWFNHAHAWRRYWRTAAQTYSDEAALWRQTRVAIDGAGIRSATPDGTTSWEWSAVREVQSRDGFVLLWVGKRSPIVIPDSALGSSARRDRLIAFAKARRPAAPS